MFFKQKGIITPQLLIALAFIGITVYLTTTTFVPFKDQLFSKLYPKTESQAYTYKGFCNCEYSDVDDWAGVTCSNGYAVYAGINVNGACEYDRWNTPSCSEYIRCVETGAPTPTPTPSSGWTYGCSGNDCYDCILSTRHDVIDNYYSWGWGKECGTEQEAIATDWCQKLDPTACQTIKQTTCASFCGYSGATPTPTPTTPPPASCPYSGDNCAYSAGDGKCYSGKTSDLSTCTPGYEGCFNPSAGCKYSCGPLTSCPKYIGGGGVTDPPNWVFCAWENGICSFSGTKLVRYGANGQYVYKTFTGDIGCNNSVFGDPIVGTVKQCHYAETTTTPTPTTAPYSFNLAPNCNNGPGLSASWNAGSGTNCNAHIYAGSTAYKVSSNCTGTWTGNQLGTGGPTVTNGGTYKLCVNNSNGQQIGCSVNTTTSCTGIDPTPTSTASCSSRLNCKYSEGSKNPKCYLGHSDTCTSSNPDDCLNQGCTYVSGCSYQVSCPGSTNSTPTPTPTPGGSCPTQTCTYTTPVATSLCPSGLYLCTGSGVTGPVNTPGCSYTNNCSSCSCYVDPNVTPSPTPIASSGSNTCKGIYPQSYLNKNPLGTNFGDPQCNFTKPGLFATIQAKDSANANTWMCMAYCESTFNPNAYNPTSPAGGAWGLFQMGSWNSVQKSSNDQGKYDRGDVAWALQAANAINYNIAYNANFGYWQCWRSGWTSNSHCKQCRSICGSQY